MPKEALPTVVAYLPKVRASELLLKVNVDKQRIYPMDFHDACDEKGPTLTLALTADGRIFGAYSPISWISENV